MPVVLAGVEREVRRDRDQLGALEREDAVELREAQVVADGEAYRPALEPRHDRLLARLLRLGLAVAVPAHLDVEEMDLPVHRHELAVGIEDEARVRELLPPLAALGD